MSGYDVDPTELFSAEAMVLDAAAQGRAEVARLRVAAQDLLGDGWRGPAAVVFGRGWAEWLDGVHAVLTALDETARALGGTGAEYERNETGVCVDLRVIV